ncbi:MAG: flagella basal body P-ring formation protein FlgA [Bacillota bacterium]|nr:flagella basal body P-ring formation protein FlgA [Bacillota bacterium]
MLFKRKKIFPLLGFTLMGLAVGLFVWYEWFGGRELINYQQVVVLKQNLNRGEEVKPDNLMYLMVEKQNVISGAITDPNQIVGKDVKNFVPGKDQLVNEFFDRADLVLHKGEYVAQIPSEWTLAFPDSMRRGDNIAIYAVNSGSDLMNSLSKKIVAHSNTSKNKATDNNSNTQNTTIDSESLNIDTSNLNKILEVKVAYVKDSTNHEVVTVGSGDRLNGSGDIHSVEIITTTDKFEKIEQQINSGAKLIMMYTDAGKGE